MSAVALGRVASAPVAARDWLTSLAAHAALIAALAGWAAWIDDPRAPPAPVPIRWVEAAPERTTADSVEEAAGLPMQPVAAPPAAVAPASAPAAPVAAAVPAPVAARAVSPSATPTATVEPLPARPLRHATPRRATSERRAVDVARAKRSADSPLPVAAPALAAEPAPVAAAALAPAASAAPAPAAASAPVAAPAPAAAPVAASAPPDHAPASNSAPAVTAAADPTPPAPFSAAQPSRWRSDFEALLLAQKRYPRQARRMGQQGVVTIHAQFAADGELLGCEVAGSSGFRALDEAAVELVRIAAGQLRASSAPGSRAELRIPIAYELNGRGT